MLLISKVIRTVDDYASWVKIAIACENNGKTEGSHNYGGYFELGNNIKSESGSIPMAYSDNYVDLQAGEQITLYIYGATDKDIETIEVTDFAKETA